ncbi:MAG: PIN domain-containing protein [Thermoproteota archaeon]
MRYLLLDTSFLIEMIKLGKDLISKSEEFLEEKLIPATTQRVLDELSEIAKRKGKNAKFASLSLKLALNFKKIFESEEKRTDLDIIKVGLKNNCVIATADIELASKAFEKGLDVIIIKEKGRIAALRY